MRASANTVASHWWDAHKARSASGVKTEAQTATAGERQRRIIGTVGLPVMAVQESKERVRAAIKNSGGHFPDHRITVNLAPADLSK